jgi:hypothetical protein
VPFVATQVFNATNDTITTLEPTAEVLAKYYPNVKITREMGEWEGPLSNRKIREMLGFKDVHNWRDYVDVEKVKAEMKQWECIKGNIAQIIWNL